jgi:hypothetical protein
MNVMQAWLTRGQFAIHTPMILSLREKVFHENSLLIHHESSHDRQSRELLPPHYGRTKMPWILHLRLPQNSWSWKLHFLQHVRLSYSESNSFTIFDIEGGKAMAPRNMIPQRCVLRKRLETCTRCSRRPLLDLGFWIRRTDCKRSRYCRVYCSHLFAVA